MPHFNKWFLSWVSFQTPNHSNYIKHTLVTSLRLSHMHPPFITTQQTSSRSIKMTKILPFVHEGQGSKNLNWKKLFKQIDCYWTVWYMTELWEPERRAVWYPLGWSPFLRKTLSRGTADEGRGCRVNVCAHARMGMCVVWHSRRSSSFQELRDKRKYHPMVNGGQHNWEQKHRDRGKLTRMCDRSNSL